MKKKHRRKPHNLLSAFRTVVVVGLGLFFLLFVISILVEEDDGQEQQTGRALSKSALQYRDVIYEELAKSEQESLAPLVLSVMMQESGGRGDDPMQASESKCGEIGCIEDASESIAYGVSHFVDVLEAADGKTDVAVQAYNFGPGFIDFVEANGGTFNKDLAIRFSQEQFEQVDNPEIYRCIRPESEELDACYGDIQYVEAVYSYLPAAEAAYEANK
ncbi:lysozyme family protein [Terribacillus sp. DMT04]|uniref:lysozyme family protein n=1 Tax=Terribacillus sp. DMT04 TaxID=2850441 RepID=UPI001C2C7D25|nr:lysozyme family protein [Terribacillus sp. DMT04]QXE02112.1 lysozyme family protein [Terribacillus sp. DMT04]